MIDYGEYTIHIVDDSKSIIAALTEVLKSKGYTVTYSTNGQSAINLINKELPSLIILDVEMPVMDGYDTIRYLKSHKETSNIPVIFHTGLRNEEVIKNLFELGASDYISKPFIAQELLARIEKEINTINLQNLLKEKMSKLADVISHDSLTQTYNRIHMTSLINKKMEILKKENSGSFSLIYIDIDNFNHFNNIHGFKSSDRALNRFAAVVKLALTDKDILSRWEGDKFMILLPGATKQRVKDTANSILENIKKTLFSPTVGLSCSIVIMEIYKEDSISNVVRIIQNRMKETKAIKKNCIVTVE